MAYQEPFRKARALVDEVLADLEVGRSASEVSSKLAALRMPDLLQIRRILDQRIAASARPLSIEVVDGGQRFGDWLVEELGLDRRRAEQMVSFIDEYGAITHQLGHEPTIPELAASAELSVATMNRRLADFRSAFPGERNPARLARALRDGREDPRLWDTFEDSFLASLADVPVADSSSGRDQDRAVQALEQASHALGGTAVGPVSLYKFMVQRGIEAPKDAQTLARTLRIAWKSGLIMRAPNDVYTPLDGNASTEWDRPLTDYYVAAEHGFPLPTSCFPGGGHQPARPGRQASR